MGVIIAIIVVVAILVLLFFTAKWLLIKLIELFKWIGVQCGKLYIWLSDCFQTPEGRKIIMILAVAIILAIFIFLIIKIVKSVEKHFIDLKREHYRLQEEMIKRQNELIEQSNQRQIEQNKKLKKDNFWNDISDEIKKYCETEIRKEYDEIFNYFYERFRKVCVVLGESKDKLKQFIDAKMNEYGEITIGTNLSGKRVRYYVSQSKKIAEEKEVNQSSGNREKRAHLKSLEQRYK